MTWRHDPPAWARLVIHCRHFQGQDNWSDWQRLSSLVRNSDTIQGRTTCCHCSRISSPFRLLPKLENSRILVSHGRVLGGIAKYPTPLETSDLLTATGSPAPRSHRKASPRRKKPYGLPWGTGAGEQWPRPRPRGLVPLLCALQPLLAGKLCADAAWKISREYWSFCNPCALLPLAWFATATTNDCVWA